MTDIPHRLLSFPAASILVCTELHARTSDKHCSGSGLADGNQARGTDIDGGENKDIVF